MASTLLRVKEVTASSYSAHYRPELVLEDAPDDSASRCAAPFPSEISEISGRVPGNWQVDRRIVRHPATTRRLQISYANLTRYSHRSSPSLRGNPEWLKLELEDPAIVSE